MQTILAIAIGNPVNSRTITNPTQLHGARPYVQGLYNYLSQQTTFKLGTDYSIDYQECWEGQEAFTGTPDIIFCMSTPVVIKAKAFSSTIPIVGIFSDPAGEHFNQSTNICGVIGKRIQKARKLYDCFVATIPNLTQVYILHRENNTASTQSLHGIQTGGGLPVPITVLPVTSQAAPPGTDPSQVIGTLITKLPTSAGLLVLPVDVFFGVADFIFHNSSLPVAWPTPDWCPPAVCANGAAQELCGQLMGAQVAYILAHPKQIPQGAARFVDVPEADIKCVASQSAAKVLKIELRKHHGLQIV